MKNVIVIIVLIAALIGVGYWGWSQYQENNRLKTVMNSKPATGESTIVNKYKDTSGREHIVLQDHPITQQQLKEGTAVTPGYVDTLAKALNIAAKNITDVTVAKITAEGQAKLYKTQLDSLKRKILYFQNKFFQASYIDGSDTLKYSYHLTLNNVGYSKRKNIFSNSYYYHDIFADDPNAVLNQIDRYTVADHVNTLSFKVQAKTFYNFKSGLLIPAAGIEVGINRITLSGNYYYDQTLNSFKPIIGAKFDLIKFER